jgi:hypothetical protein
MIPSPLVGEGQGGGRSSRGPRPSECAGTCLPHPNPPTRVEGDRKKREASDLRASTPATPEVQPGFWLCRANVPQAGISQCRKWRRPVRIIAIPCSSQAVMVSSSLLEPPG